MVLYIKFLTVPTRNINSIPKLQQENFSYYPITSEIHIDDKKVLASYKRGEVTFYEGRLGIKIIAVKRSSFDRITKEFEIAANLKHSNILHILHAPTQIDQKCVLVTEIFDCTLNRDSVKNTSDEKSMMLQLVDAVEYLSDLGIIHLDIAPQNIFIATVGTKKVTKLGNFEHSRHGPEVKGVNIQNLTDGFRAPEIVTRKTAYHESCLWSLGGVFFYITTKGFKLNESCAVLTRLNATIEDESNDKILIKDLLTRILKDNPRDRLKPANIIEHPFFWNALKTKDFILKVANAIESPNSKTFYGEISKGQHKVIQRDWIEILNRDSELFDEIKKARKDYKQKKGNSEGDKDNNIRGNSIVALIY
jgi:serine/threonine protein kinase